MHRSALHTYKGDTECIDTPQHHGLGPNLGNTEEIPKSLTVIFSFNCTGCISSNYINLEDKALSVYTHLKLTFIYLFSFQRQLFELPIPNTECSNTIHKTSFHNLPTGKNEIKTFQAKTSKEKKLNPSPKSSDPKNQQGDTKHCSRETIPTGIILPFTPLPAAAVTDEWELLFLFVIQHLGV